MKQEKSFWLTPTGLAALGVIAVYTYFLFMEHQQHVFQFLPYVLLFVCPLMHLFMHRGHKHGDHAHNDQNESTQKEYRRGYEDALKQQRSEHNHR